MVSSAFHHNVAFIDVYILIQKDQKQPCNIIVITNHGGYTHKSTLHIHVYVWCNKL